MNTAVATKMPARSPVAMSAAGSAPTSGMNSAGRELATKNSTSGPMIEHELEQRIELRFCRSWRLLA